jgi:TPR repeat protein
MLGDLYREGTAQNAADLQLAELAWQLAAAAGSGKAMLSLGKFYEGGACGTETRVNAEFWYGLAARDNDVATREAATDGLNRIATKQ